MKRYSFKDKMVGLYNPDTNKFTKHVKRQIHRCHKYKAWGIDYEAFCDIPDDATIEFIDETKTYSILCSEAQKCAIVDTLDRKSGRQVFIPEDKFVISN